MVQQYLVSLWFIYSWLLLALQVKVGKVTSFVGKILPHENYPLYDMKKHGLGCIYYSVQFLCI